MYVYAWSIMSAGRLSSRMQFAKYFVMLDCTCMCMFMLHGVGS